MSSLILEERWKIHYCISWKAWFDFFWRRIGNQSFYTFHFIMYKWFRFFFRFCLLHLQTLLLILCSSYIIFSFFYCKTHTWMSYFQSIITSILFRYWESQFAQSVVWCYDRDLVFFLLISYFSKLIFAVCLTYYLSSQPFDWIKKTFIDPPPTEEKWWFTKIQRQSEEFFFSSFLSSFIASLAWELNKILVLFWGLCGFISSM